MKKIGLLLLLAFALLIVGLAVIQYAPRLSQKSLPHAQSSQPLASSGVQLQVAHIYNATSTYRVNAQYPQFGIPAIDTQIKSAVEKAVQEFEALPPNPPGSAAQQNEFIGSFNSAYMGTHIISTELALYQYTGGAHGNTAYLGMNFDRTSGKELTLNDALALTGLTLQQVAASSTAQLSAQLGSTFFASGAKASAGNYGTFLVSADKVTFLFQLYQVAPYAAGPQKVSFPRVK